MKKFVLLICTLFCSFFLINNVLAADWTVGTLTCKYEKDGDIITINYYNVAAATGDAEVYYSIEKVIDGKTYCYTDAMISKCSADTEPWVTFGIYNFDSSFKYNDKNLYSIKSRLTRRAYVEDINFNTEELCSKGVIFTDLMNDGMDDIVLCETTDTVNTDAKTECDSTDPSLYKLSGKTLGKNSYAGSNDTDYTDTFNETKTLQEKYCDENGPEYNAELCAQYTADVNLTVEEAEKTGTTEAELEKSYGDFKALNDLTFKDPSCNALLGDKLDHNAPAYYMNFAFELIKYAAIIIFFVLTIIEYSKAVASSNQDAIKKASQTTIKRLLIAVIIFFLPILIDFILRLLGVISTNGTCGIGF